MSASALLRVLASSTVVVVSLTSPSDLLLETPTDGWEPADRAPDARPADLDFAAYAAIEPDSVAHIDPTSELADRVMAAVDHWSRGTAETLIIEIVRSPDADTATSFVDQAAARAIESGLAAADPPFEAAWAYSGPVDDGWMRILSWSQGRFSVTLTLHTPTESAAEEIESVASVQTALIVDETGIAPGEVTEPDEPLPEADDGGIPVRTMLLWLGVAVLTVWWFVGLRRRLTDARRHHEADDTAHDVDATTPVRPEPPVELRAEQRADREHPTSEER